MILLEGVLEEALVCQGARDSKTGDRGWMHIVLEVETEVTLYRRLIVSPQTSSVETESRG